MKDQIGSYFQFGLFGRWFDQGRPNNGPATQTSLKKQLPVVVLPDIVLDNNASCIWLGL
jgi:hypothetical protein